MKIGEECEECEEEFKYHRNFLMHLKVLKIHKMTRVLWRLWTCCDKFQQKEYNNYLIVKNNSNNEDTGVHDGLLALNDKSQKTTKKLTKHKILATIGFLNDKSSMILLVTDLMVV